VPDVAAARDLMRKDDAVSWVRAGFGQAGGGEEGVVALGDRAAGLIPALDVLELDARMAPWKPSMRAFQPTSSW
jgi:hypothetical protein